MQPASSREEMLFQAATDLPGPQRAAFLDRECAGDPALRARLDALLAAHEQSDGLLASHAEANRPTISLELSDLPDPAVGMTIGRYKLLEKLGEGGCGVVYVAEQTEPVRRRVALKVIKLGMDTREVIARFEAERQALALMDHPNIAKVLDAGVIGERSDIRDQRSAGGAADSLTSDLRPLTSGSGRPYFVMELVRGVRITDYCDRHSLTIQDRLDLFIKVCQAIQHAHQKGIIHRDIKPSNILVTLHDGVPAPKVIDFGIAKATEGRLTNATVYTQLHQFVGTPAYMSPEQAEMSALDIDTRSDIYSLGLLLYEILTGRPPFDPKELMAQGIDAMRKTIREQEPVRPSTRLATLERDDLTTTAKRRAVEAPRLVRLVTGDLDWIVMKCLEKDRTRRYETANGLAADLQRHLQDEPVVARPPSALHRLQKAWRRHRVGFAAGATVGAVLLISVVVLTWALDDQKKARKRAEEAQLEQGRERAKAEAAGQVAAKERDRAARLLSVSQAVRGVELLEKHDPTGLLHLLEARKSVEHLPEERLQRTLLWSGWMNSLPKPEIRVVKAPSALASAQDHFGGKPVALRRGLPWIVAGSTNGEVTLSEPATGKLVTRFSTGNQRVGSPELSANGRLLAVNVSGSFQLWDLAPAHSNQPPRRLLGRIHRIAFDPEHRRVLTLANQDMPVPGDPPEQQPDPATPFGYQIQIWDSTVEPCLITTWEGDRQDFANHQFAFSSDGTKVAAAAREISLWDARTGQPAKTALSTNGVAGARDFSDPFWFSPDGRWLWEVRRTACLRYDLNTGQLAAEPVTGLHRYQRPWLASDGAHLVVSLTNGFQVLNLDRGEPMGPTIALTDDNVRALALSPYGLKLATAGPDRALRVWDTTTGQQAGPTHMPPMATSSASFTADGKGLEIFSRSIDFDTRGMSATSGSGPARIISLEAPPPTWITNWAGVRVIGFRSSDGELLTYTKSEGTMSWRDPATGRSSLSWHVAGNRDMIGSALNPEGTLVAATFSSGEKVSEIEFWETASGRLLEPSSIWTNQGALAFSPDGQTLAGLGGYDGSGSVQLWDVASRQPREYLPSAPKELSWLSLWFSPDGRFIAARNSYAISVWDVATGRLATGGEIDFYLAISDDWTRALGQELLDFTDPRNPRPAPSPLTAASRGAATRRTGMALSPDGRLRAAEAGDRTMRLWDNLTDRPVGHEMKLANPARQQFFSPDGRLLVVFEWAGFGGRAGPGMSLRLWETSTSLACGPAIPARDLPVELLFDHDVRWLTQKAPFDTTETLLIQLPQRDLSLSEMERQSWRLSGCRLDEAGNVEIISDEEFLRLEATGDRQDSAGLPAVPAASRPEVSRAVAAPANSTLPSEIQNFIIAQEERVHSLATRQNRPLPAALTNYFAAARSGNWLQASNAYAVFSSQIEQGPFDEGTALLFLLRQAALDSYIALEFFTQGQPEYATAFGRDVVASLPAGSIYFGGTDAGRGLVTAFAKSKSPAEAIFVLTQNALADDGYLTYARETYGHRIYVPTQDDLGRTFQQYVSDAQHRLEHDRSFPAEPRQLKPGEEVKEVDGRVQISGQVAVMGVNALLARAVFEQNPQRDFYVEESFPLDWMYPHLEPHGLIMRLSRGPLAGITPEAVRRDQEFWSRYLTPLVGGWLQEKTPVAEVCDFAARVFVRKDLNGFNGDPAYVADSYACKAFSKLRGSQAGLYQWRATQAQDDAERQAMRRAADFASRQALALCPYSPEVVFRYASALTSEGRTEYALRADEQLTLLHEWPGTLVFGFEGRGRIRMGFSPDGKRLMTYGLPPGRSPGEIQFWDVAARRPLGLPHPVPGICWDYQFDPDSRYLVVSFLPGDDRIHAKVWRLPAEDAPPSAPPPTPNADSIDVRDVGFKTPEYVVWDRTADVYLVSNIHGHPLDKDDNGFISRVRPDGSVEALKWIDGASEGVTLHAPKGMAILRDSLWVADIDVLREFDRSTGRALKEVPVPAATQMNKILPFPNGLGIPAGCLVTDTEHWTRERPDPKRPGTSFLHMIDLDHGEVTTTPNNPWVRPSRVRGGVFEADLDLQSAHPFGQVTGAAMTSGGFGLVAWDRPWAYNIESGFDLDKVGPIRLPRGQSYDVIVLPPVGGGEVGTGERWLISSWAGRCLYVVQLDEPVGPTVSEWLRDLRAPAKLAYDVKRNRVLVPLYLDDALLIRPGPGSIAAPPKPAAAGP